MNTISHRDKLEPITNIYLFSGKKKKKTFWIVLITDIHSVCRTCEAKEPDSTGTMWGLHFKTVFEVEILIQNVL